MKKLFTLLMLSMMLFVSCSDDDDPINNFEPSLEVNLDSQTIAFSFDGNSDTYSINISSNTKWTASSDATWLKLSSTSGEGDATIYMTADENIEETEQTAKIIVKADGLDKEATISIIQQKRPKSTAGLYILSEGSWGSNQSELAYYDFKTGTLSKKIFKENNDTILGDVGNDLAIYGSKMYCVVSGTNEEAANGYIVIIDPATNTSIKRIPFVNAEGEADLPRRIAFHKNKAYVTAHSGVVARLDTASLTIDSYAKLSGNGTEGIAKYDGKLYTCNSGKGSGNSISVIDIASFKETKAITVPRNPVNIRASNTGEIYFSTDMLYDADPMESSKLHSINVKSEKITSYYSNAGRLAIGNGYIYSIETDYTTFGSYAKKLNLTAEGVSDFTTELPAYFMGYSVSVNPLDGNIYAMGQGQDVAILDADGNLIKHLKVGTGFGNTVVPVYEY
jgi:hypothetical protein